jgi:hypothetical protein
MYRVGGRNTPARKVTIGVYGKITVEDARKVASRILAKAELGEDVAAERAHARAEMTVGQLCDEYLVEGITTKKPSTIATDRSRIEAHIRPLLGGRPIGQITQGDVAKFLIDVAEGRTARDVRTRERGRSIVTGGKGAATRTVRLLGGIFSYAVSRGLLKESPCRGVKLYKDGRGERFLSMDEFRKLGETLRLAETGGLPWLLKDGARAASEKSCISDREMWTLSGG